MGFVSTKDYVDAGTSGSRVRSSFQRVFNSSAAAVAGRWYDFSMMQGDPQCNIYPVTTPLAAHTLNYLSDGNLWHGGNKLPETKHLKNVIMYSSAATTCPTIFLLCDYLMYYPLIHPNISTVPQTFNNSITLPRYTDGNGVRMFLVATSDLGPYASTVVITYVNSDGNSETTGGTFYVPTSSSYPLSVVASTPITCIPTSAANTISCFAPFIPLCPLSHGIRSVTSIQFLTGMGGGTCALVLVKPLAYIPAVTVSVASERDYFVDIPSLPQIYDGACLNILALPSAAIPLGSIYQGYFEFISG